MTYRTKGTCSREILYWIDDDDRILDVKFLNAYVRWKALIFLL